MRGSSTLQNEHMTRIADCTTASGHYEVVLNTAHGVESHGTSGRHFLKSTLGVKTAKAHSDTTVIVAWQTSDERQPERSQMLVDTNL